MLFLFKRKPHKIIFVAGTLSLIAILTGFTGEEGKKSNTPDVTGAPFDKYLTCTKCHGGGDFGGYILTELYNKKNIAVTSYIPGETYTLKISLVPTTGTPLKYGFQTTCAKLADLTDIDAWRRKTMPSIYYVKYDKNHHYVEHTDRINKLPTGYISLQWVGPAAGTGAVIFFTAGNIANGDSTTAGDQIVNNNFTVQEDTLSAKPLQQNERYSLTIISSGSQNWLHFINNSSSKQKLKVYFSDFSGNLLKTESRIAEPGENKWLVPELSYKGYVIANIITADGFKTSVKLNSRN